MAWPSVSSRSCRTYSGFFAPPRFCANSEKNIAMDRSVAMLQSAVMFEVRFQTYRADVDAAGIVYFSHFFRYAEQAEEELFRAAGKERLRLIEEHHVWMPRVEAF